MKRELESEQIIQNKVNAFNRLSHMKKIFIKKKSKCKLRAGICDQKEDTCGKKLISYKKGPADKTVKMNPYSYLVSNIMGLFSG